MQQDKVVEAQLLWKHLTDLCLESVLLSKCHDTHAQDVDL